MAEARQVTQPSLDQSDPFLPAPALNLLLASKGILDTIAVLEADQAYRYPSPRVGGTFAVVVLPESALEIPRASDIERPVSAVQHVHERHARQACRESVQAESG